MWTYHPDLLATPVPRYTSYPTAAEFHEGVGPADMAAALDRVDADTELSLYLHIPFCHAICWYCGCNTGAANRTARLDAYLARLSEEIELVARRLGGRGQVGRIAFGGGSPNAIALEAFLRLVTQAKAAFGAGAPVLSVEVDPRGFDAAWAGALAEAGATRVSLGVQTFDPALQGAIGRVQPRGDIAGTVDLLRHAGIESINFDLMYGLPGQTDQMLAESIEESVAMGADRLAVFGYAHVPHLIPRQRRIDATALPGAEVRFAQAALAYEKLAGAGYAAIGFDHFARPGDAIAVAAREGRLRRNFQGFTEDEAEVLIGLGASAISQFPDLLVQNEKNAGRWHMAISSGRFAAARGVRRSVDDQWRAAAIEELLCQGRADLGGIGGRAAIALRLARFAALKLVRWEGSVLLLAPGALPYARVIASAIDSHRGPAATRFSSAV
ncbi:oxygen-independent coproporphyrinogen-3 oxidase [Sphingomonas sp. NFR04]|uniref:oxygen-independent coproporphyrinogen III oxidase n=1 Tax=Sphingomonas sp. NFR04 TaxID=1566283 RepID=UPI0008F26B2B|nr:oxygen-independent coproporphyrinogen III oxidase [Sphingomonas sp. NFR04]SFK43115.1 oxygen-independent coproporphyrinogen-3 oxidase [Sphingomonas sp. NFR04]